MRQTTGPGLHRGEVFYGYCYYTTRVSVILLRVSSFESKSSSIECKNSSFEFKKSSFESENSSIEFKTSSIESTNSSFEYKKSFFESKHESTLPVENFKATSNYSLNFRMDFNIKNFLQIVNFGVVTQLRATSWKPSFI